MLKLVESPFKEKVMRKAILGVGSGAVEIKFNTQFIGLAHYLFWKIKCNYCDKEYVGYVDTCDGTAIYVKYSKSLEVELIILNLVLLISSLIAGLIVTVLSSRYHFGRIIRSLLFSLPAPVLTLKRRVERER